MLILDEPTNHLDMDMIERLEKELKKTSITLLLVTHDRYVLERVCTDIYELDRGQLFCFPGNYAYYLEKKAEREALDTIHLHKLKQHYKAELDRVRKAPRARGSKSVEREEKFYALQQNFSTTKSAQQDASHKLIIDVSQSRLGDKVCTLHHISKSYGDKKIITDFSRECSNGQRIGILGKNGVGKSTLCEIITGDCAPDT